MRKRNLFPIYLLMDRSHQTATMEHHSVFSPLGFDNSFDLEEFKKNFKIKIISYDENELVFDLIGVDAAVANAFRRILIAEVSDTINTVLLIIWMICS
jgi:DNA-directed RNA polymerase I and III subunit RPAC1